MMKDEHSADTHNVLATAQERQRGELLYVWSVAERGSLKYLVKEVKRRFAEAGEQVNVHYSISIKTYQCHLFVEAIHGVPSSVISWLKTERLVIDYIVRIAPESLEEWMNALDRATRRYSRRLDPPPVPTGYTLRAEPTSIDRPSDEIWVGAVQSADSYESMSILLYDERGAQTLLEADEAIMLLAYLLKHARPLLRDCPLEFLIAPQHVALLSDIKRSMRAYDFVTPENAAQRQESHDAK